MDLADPELTPALPALEGPIDRIQLAGKMGYTLFIYKGKEIYTLQLEEGAKIHKIEIFERKINA